MTPNDELRTLLAAAVAHALDYLEAPPEGPVAATATAAELRRRLAHPLGERGLPAAQVIDDLVDDVQGGLLRSTGGRFFAWVIGGSLPSALAADWLTSAWDQNAASHAAAPAAAVVEEICGAWLLDLLRLPPTASFAFTNGCQMAHFTCLAAARNAVLERYGWDVEARGLSGAPAIRVLSSGLRHASLDRALRFLGLGTDSIVEPPADSVGRLLPESLEAALGADGPALLLLCAGDIHTGACDRFREVIPLAHARGAWVHVDGAFGLWANASPRFRHLLDGVELADSWACDGHKWLNVPYDSGYAFVAEPAAHRRAMRVRASYLTPPGLTWETGSAWLPRGGEPSSGGTLSPLVATKGSRRSPLCMTVRDQHDWNPDWSRRARGFATYAALRELGRSGVAELVERCCRHALDLVARLGALPGAQVMYAPELNQGLVRFPDPAPGASEAEHDAHTDRVIGEIVRAGRIMVGGTTWQGRRCMRISVCNWQTCEDDVKTAVEAVREALAL